MHSEKQRGKKWGKWTQPQKPKNTTMNNNTSKMEVQKKEEKDEEDGGTFKYIMVENLPNILLT